MQRGRRQGDARSAIWASSSACRRSPQETGYPYYNVWLQLLSKYPIHEPSGADGLYA